MSVRAHTRAPSGGGGGGGRCIMAYPAYYPNLQVDARQDPRKHNTRQAPRKHNTRPTPRRLP